MIVYFDQNALSDLRERKRKNSDTFSIIFKLIEDKKISVRYSRTHLDEIKNISVSMYQDEHIDLLDSVRARYLGSTKGVIDIRTPWSIWNEYLDSEMENSFDGSNDAYLALENLSKKISGIPSTPGFLELHEEIQDIALSMIMSAEDNLLDVTHEELAFAGTSAKAIKESLNKLKEQAMNMEAINIAEDEELGPRSFRALLNEKGMNMADLPSHRVINIIEDLMYQESGYRFPHRDQEDVSSKISVSYTLMNWAGYYPDDFTKIKKGKDRFKASNYDKEHVLAAHECDFLVSSDFRFSKKALACYDYIGSKTKVVEPDWLAKNL